MVILLRVLFAAVLVAMAAGTVRASLAEALFDIPAAVTGDPWFQVTLLDAYFGFLTFYVWVCWKETSLGARLLWFVAVMLWGNFAMATYMLIELARVPASGPVGPVFTTRRPGRVGVPLAFTVGGVGVYVLGAWNVLFPA